MVGDSYNGSKIYNISFALRQIQQMHNGLFNARRQLLIDVDDDRDQHANSHRYWPDRISIGGEMDVEVEIYANQMYIYHMTVSYKLHAHVA